MSYTTHFWGKVTLDPPLNDAEIAFLHAWKETRHEGRDTPGLWNRDESEGGFKFRGVWCQWVPTSDGTALEWNGEEKFYEADGWMRYLIDQLLKPGAAASTSGGEQYAGFSFDHTANGVVFAEAEPEGFGMFDVWRLDVVDGVVSKTTYDVPHLDWREDQEELLASFDLVSAVEAYRQDPAAGLSSLEGYLRALGNDLGQPAVQKALGRFVWDAALVLPETERLRTSLQGLGLSY